jgi:hypothetical protein
MQTLQTLRTQEPSMRHGVLTALGDVCVDENDLLQSLFK